MTVEPPIAASNRWQPLRTGLVDLFYYDQQEFWFRDGRILFRGNNGTGKSKVLALTLPFLLDGDLTPSRVEPDGDRDKRMEWNLLLGGRYEERLGYSWLEFGRITEDGERAYVTIGCGMKAAAGRGIVDRWFFLTSQRVGTDLFLIGPSGNSLTRDRLVEAVGLHGQVTQKAEHYRRMIDEHLFHLGQERYGALINLLIQLRQPQLSKRPDPGRLSKALSDALAPVDQALISDIATAFHDLEQQREELKGLRETRGHVARFLDRYRRYAQVAARRQGGRLRAAHSGYEHLRRDLADVREQIARAEAEEQASAEALENGRREHAEQNAIREELGSDPRLKNLADAERYAEETATAADRQRQAAERARQNHDQRLTRRAAAERSAEQTRSAVDDAAAGAAGPSAAAGIAEGHAALVAPLALPDGILDDGARDGRSPSGVSADGSGVGEGRQADGASLTEANVAVAERAARRLAAARLDAVEHVSSLAETARQREADLTRARAVLTEREGDADTAADRLGEAQDGLTGAVGRHVDDWRGYRRSLTELVLPDPEELDLAHWAESLDGPHPGRAALREAAQTAQRSLASEQARYSTELEERTATLTILTEERQRHERGEVERPPLPPTRGPGVRDGRPGAPLWQVVDFVDSLDAGAKAGLEAALEAAGLLDAWLTPTGWLLEPGTHDVVALPTAPVAHNLTGVLRPAVDPAAGIGADAVHRVLAGIGHGEQDAPVWIGADGRFRLGPLHGEWSKPAAAFVGAGAREEARRRRLTELAELIEVAEHAIAETRVRMGVIGERQAVLAAELDREPADQALRDAHSDVTGAGRLLTQTRLKVDEASNDVDWAARDLAAALADRDVAATDLRLPGDLLGLDTVRQAVISYREAASGLFAAVRRHADRITELVSWNGEVTQAAEELARALLEAAEATTTAAEERGRLETLKHSIGASVEELELRLSAVRTRIAALTAEIKRLDTAHKTALETRSRAQGRDERLAADLAAETERRDAAVRDYRRFAATGLLLVACPDLDMPDPDTPWAADPTVRLARRAEALLTDVDDGDEAWRRIQDDITRRYSELSEALSRHGHHAVAGLDDWFVVAIQFQGRERPPAELTGLLDSEIAYRDRMLTAKERDVLEEHLVNDVASHLQELISEAETQVAHMNAELEERPTSTGMRLRLRWETVPDGPPGLPEARARLLRQDAELWSPADRAAVGEFLARQIESERAKDEEGTWSEHLRTALDYRGWHRFVIERYQDGRWRSAVGPASGGERVLTVSLPLFAAASSHYRSAHPHAPRLVALDEAFAGVDDDSRAKCLGLLATFDLDVVMTSEREWGFYATVPGIATHQLVRRDGVDAVHVTTWEWDGRTSKRIERDPAGHGG